MKKLYITPAAELVVLCQEEMICVSGVEGTSNFWNKFTGETTDEALSRRHGGWNDDDWDDDF